MLFSPLDESERGEWKSWLKTQHSKNEDYGIQSHHSMANRWRNNGNSDRLFIFGGSKITADGDCSHEIKRCLLLGSKAITNQPRQHIKKQRHYFADKGLSSQSYGFSSSHVWMWELDHKEGWAPKNWCFWTVMLDKTLESPFDCKEIKLVNPKGNQSWILFGRKDWCWSWNSNTLATWCKELTPWKRPWCWERLKTRGEEDNRGWDGWTASLTWRTWVWASSGTWWWTGKPDVMLHGSQRVGHDWATELNWRECSFTKSH